MAKLSKNHETIVIVKRAKAAHRTTVTAVDAAPGEIRLGAGPLSRWR